MEYKNNYTPPVDLLRRQIVSKQACPLLHSPCWSQGKLNTSTMYYGSFYKSPRSTFHMHDKLDLYTIMKHKVQLIKVSHLGIQLSVGYMSHLCV